MSLPPMPISPYLDSESNVATNKHFSAMHAIGIDIRFETTPTNNLQLTFGNDANGDKELGFDETDIVLGWDSGCYFIENVHNWQRFEEVSTSANAPFRLGYRIKDGNPNKFFATIGGQSAFTNLTAETPAWLYSPQWDMVRATRRGLEEPSDWIDIAVTNRFFAIRLR